MNRKVQIKTSIIMRAAFALFVVMLTAAPAAWAQQSATVNIGTNNEWSAFVEDFNVRGVYNNYQTVTVNINCDIGTSAMLGTSTRNFSGTINGNGHTIKFIKGNLSTYYNEEYAALFRYVDTVTIRDLHIKGEIYTSRKYAAAFIGSASGTNYIINCRSSVAIESSVSGDGTHGGFVATVASGTANKLFIEGCVFDGKLRGTNTHSCGGFIGWRGNSSTVKIYNSLFAPNHVTVKTNGSATFARNHVDTYNSYYTYLLNDGRSYAPTHGTDHDNNGQAAHSVTAASPLSISIPTPSSTNVSDNDSTYTVSGITIFKDGNTTQNVILYQGTYYAGIGQTINVKTEAGYIMSNSPDYSGVSSLSISGSDNLWTFTMPNASITLSARGTISPDPHHFSVSTDGNTYTIKTSTGWNVFCDCLQDTAQYHRFAGKTVKLKESISVTRMAGSSYHDMKGTFDGNGKTLTVSYGTSDSPINEQNVAPFRNAESGCTIKNLKVAGDIYTSAINAAGLIGTQYGTVHIENCIVSTNIYSHTSGDGTHGGFVAYIGNNVNAKLYITGCLFDGRLLSSGSTPTNKCGGFVGWRGNNAQLHITNSVYMPNISASYMRHTWISAQGSATFVRNGATSITNSYYSAKFNPNSNADNNSVTVQGKQMRKIFGVFLAIAPSPYANPTNDYTVSGIKAYVSGGDSAIMINDTLYSGKNNTLRLRLGTPDPGNYYKVYNGTLSGTSDPYTLTIGENDADVAIAEENMQDCPMSTDLYVYGITANSANLSWVCDTTTTNFQIKRVRSGLNDTVPSTVTANRDGNIFNTTISGLSSNTEYKVYVRTNCGDNYNNDGYSSWSEAATFTTLEECPAGKVCIGFGAGSATTPTLPIDGHYKYSFTEQIYTADELGLNNGEAITSLDFFASVTNLQRDLDIYIVNTTKSQFTNDNDWIPVTSADLVFSGRVTFNNTWNTITLDEPFAYTGGNICIVVDDNTGMANTYVTFRDFYSAGSSIFFRSDSYDPDPINGINISGSKVDVKNIIRVGKGTMPACRRPYGLTAYNVASHEATLNWDHVNVSSVRTWEIKLKNGDDSDTITVSNPLGNNITETTLTNLTQYTTYTFQVRAISMFVINASNIRYDTSNWSAPYTFTTPFACPAPVSISASNIRSTSAKLSWTSSATTWKLAYKTYDADNFDTIDINENPYTLTGLDPAVEYIIKLQAICNAENQDEGYSLWSHEYRFYTAEPCPDETVCIGTGNSANVNLPYNTNNNYSFSEQIYTAEELGLTDTVDITSVQFYNPFYSDTRQISIYMIHTTNSNFNNSFFPALSDDLVFSGTVTFETAAWNTINFDRAFRYNGTQNICLAISASSDDRPFFGAQFRVFDAPEPDQSIYIVDNNPVFDPQYGQATGQGIKANVKNCVRFGYESAGCKRPTGLAVSYSAEDEQSATTATITWNNNDQDARFILDYNGTIVNNITGNSYTLENLNNDISTEYTVRLKRDCGSGDTSNWSKAVSFRTSSCVNSQKCTIRFDLGDQWGDSWDGAGIEVIDLDENRSLDILTRSGSVATRIDMHICQGHDIELVWHNGKYDNECTYDIYYWQSNINRETSHGETILEGTGAMSEPFSFTVDCAPRPAGLTATDITDSSASLSWYGSYSAYNLRYRKPLITDATTATIILDYKEDVWGDSSGYQLLLDPTATAYGTAIASYAANFRPTDEIYNAFEYKLPANAHPDSTEDCRTSLYFGQRDTIVIPAGIYDYYLVNPSPQMGRTFVARNYGSFDGYGNDYYFEPGKTYIITITDNNGECADLSHPMTEWTVKEINSSTASYYLDELDPNTHYEWEVQGIDDNNTEWSVTANFTTANFIAPAGVWMAISTPVHDEGKRNVDIANVDGLTTPDYDLFRYNESSAKWENQKSGDNAAGFDTLEVGRGYIYRCSTERPLYFNGVDNYKAQYSVDLTANGNSDLKGFNLVGNPYPYPMLVRRAFYSLNADGTWQLHPNGDSIDVAQGILVYTESENGETLTFYASTHSTNLGSKGNLPPVPEAFCLSDHCDDATYIPPVTGNFAILDGDNVVITATGALRVYDIMGRLLFAKDVSNSPLSIPQTSFPGIGVYILRLAGQTQKIVIR